MDVKLLDSSGEAVEKGLFDSRAVVEIMVELDLWAFRVGVWGEKEM